MKPGKIFVISTGPGSSDLITVRGARLLGQLDVLYVPAGKQGGESLALTIVRDYLVDDLVIRTRHFPMSKSQQEKTAAWDGIAEEMYQDTRQGLKVGFISLGDSMLFSTWVFLLERLQGKVEIEIVPGVTSFSAISAMAQFPMAMETQSMAVMACTADEVVLARALEQHDCVVLMKVYGRFEQIKQLLIRKNLLSHAVLVANVSLAEERCFTDLNQIADPAVLPYFSTILVNRRWSSC